jgi:hypothetical protein
MPRFSAQDLLMRYHWGLGVGHLHAHQPVITSGYVGDELDHSENCQDDLPPDLEPEKMSDVQIEDRDRDIYDSDEQESRMEICDLEGIGCFHIFPFFQDMEDEDFTGM